MAKKISNKKYAIELRKKAEVKLQAKRKKTVKGTPIELEHEINVHKIELEMQNAELLSTQKKLESYIKQYTSLFEMAPVAYYILDLNGFIINANKKGMSLLGVDEAQLTGKNLSSFIHTKLFQDKFYLHRNLILEKEGSQQFECKFKKGDASLFYGLIDSCVIKDEKNKFKYFLSVISDISAQKLQERLLETALNREKELSRMKSQFVSIASHEFRTPLATILTSAELIEKYNKTEDVEKKEKHFRKIKTSVSRMKEILMDFLSVDEVEKGKITNSPETFNLIEFIKYQIEETKQFNGIHTQNYEHIGKFENACLDKKLLKTCLTNLIINAYKYSPEGGVIQIISKQTSLGNIEIKVIDKGIGIPKQDQEHIFSRFFRAKNAENTQGTGLGLNITRDLIKLMGGTISFISDENKGSTFALKFTK